LLTTILKAVANRPLNRQLIQNTQFNAEHLLDYTAQLAYKSHPKAEPEWSIRVSGDHSALMLAARITLPHCSVSSTISFATSWSELATPL